MSTKTCVTGNNFILHKALGPGTYGWGGVGWVISFSEKTLIQCFCCFIWTTHQTFGWAEILLDWWQLKKGMIYYLTLSLTVICKYILLSKCVSLLCMHVVLYTCEGFETITKSTIYCWGWVQNPLHTVVSGLCLSNIEQCACFLKLCLGEHPRNVLYRLSIIDST